MSQVKGPSTFVSEAYQLDGQAGTVDFYKKWADDYDHQMLDELEYVAPLGIARLLHEHLPDTESEIFDVGCGTGLTCRLLADNGYRALDGIDLSPDMVRVAGEQGIYRELIVGDVNEPIDRLSSSYDGVISSGTFTHGHVKADALDEILRVLKPGACFACTIHREVWQSAGFEGKFAHLMASGIAELESMNEQPFYKNAPDDGRFCVIRRL